MFVVYKQPSLWYAVIAAQIDYDTVTCFFARLDLYFLSREWKSVNLVLICIFLMIDTDDNLAMCTLPLLCLILWNVCRSLLPIFIGFCLSYRVIGIVYKFWIYFHHQIYILWIFFSVYGLPFHFLTMSLISRRFFFQFINFSIVVYAFWFEKSLPNVSS